MLKQFKKWLKVLEKLKSKRIKYKFDENTIEILREELGLMGDGTQESPFIIENLRDFAEISVRTKSYYLLLRKQTISKLSIVDSENIIIKDCVINDLEITACRYLTFVRNHIDSVKQLLCRDCYFENNGILKDKYSKLINNTYERRTFVFVWICLGVGVLYTLFATIPLVYLYISLDSIILLVAGVSLSIAMVFVLNMRYKLNKVPDNKYFTGSTSVDIKNFIENRSVKEEIKI